MSAKIVQKAKDVLIDVNTGTSPPAFEMALHQALATSENPHLRLPNNWDLAKGPGGAARAAQLVATWARAVPEPILLTHAAGVGDEGTIDRFAKQLYGLTGAMLAARVLAKDGASDITKEITEKVRVRASAMNDLDLPNLQRGQAVDLVCIDPSSYWQLKPFYHPSGTDAFRSPSEFDGLVRELVYYNAPHYAASIAPNISDLAGALRELFVNTHVHARKDAVGQRYRRGVRGVIFAQRNVPRHKAIEFSRGVAPLIPYLEALKTAEPRDTLKMIELTVFDSGPGFAARMNGGPLQEDYSLDLEQDLVEKCFLKNVSSISDPGYGLGLTRVLHALKSQRGFLSLRTGRLSLFKSYPPGGLDPSHALEDPDFRLEQTPPDDGEMKSAAMIAGTVVTILFPVGINRQ